ncbi:MAG TPA: hypothetical protein VGD46_05080 [Rhizobacter sp.]
MTENAGESQIDNPRFENVSGDFTYEAVAPRIEINWDPRTDSGTVCFWVELEEYHNGVYTGQRRPHKHWAMRPLVVPLEDLAKVRSYTVLAPDGQGGFIEIAVAPGLMGLLVKTAFNDVYGERAAQLPAINNELPQAPVIVYPEPPAPIEDDPLFQEPPAE